MTVDKLAETLRAAYADFIGEEIVPWKQAAADRKKAWRAIAKAAMKALLPENGTA